MKGLQDKVVVVTGGLGCAPSVSIIHHVLAQRSAYGHLTILQGVKHADDLIWRARYDAWQAQPDVTVGLAADVASATWHGTVGQVTRLIEPLDLHPADTIAMLCGPEVMMQAAATALHDKGLPAAAIHVSMERNMQCAVGHCGHCQSARHFVCRDGPVFAWTEVRGLLGARGY